jgi:hypothetical protein
MTWEALGAMGSILSACVIAVTGVFAYRQLRALRQSAQLEGFLHLQKEFYSPEMSDARDFASLELPELLKDEQFTADLATGKINRRRHKEILLGNFMETIGMLLHYGALDGRLFFEEYVYIAPRTWQQLSPVVAILRKASPRQWEHFEYFARKCEAMNMSSFTGQPYFESHERPA